MLTVHHLNDSRAQKTIWLLEELGLPYDLVPYQRHQVTMMAPPALKALHPVGKSPMIEDEGRIVIESGAITEHIIERHGDGRLAPVPGTDAHERYRQWLYYAVSSGMNPIMIKVYARAFGLDGSPIDEAANTELATALAYIDDALADAPFLLGEDFSAADIQMSFIPEIAQTLMPIDAYHHIVTWLNRLHGRPAFRRSIERGGDYKLADKAGLREPVA
ncbi:glutathione S-transferase family protein [Sphingobium sp. AR-3-1]|uniref:glutathione transferase n=1 Tax=Sphingobium psychrophilum TaxID=2728834 RepID=A0A7X9WRN6_9SPHN|nr:glutathione S-transferase family protein [Sphingobium psychrophilum]NML08658.1 glutathione S-transferase family protein [Sphingobium psychrophilum]